MNIKKLSVLLFLSIIAIGCKPVENLSSSYESSSSFSESISSEKASEENNSIENSFSNESTTSSVESIDSSTSSLTSSSLSSSNTTSSQNIISSSSSNSSNSVINDRIPSNKDNKVVLGNDNKSMTHFAFENSQLPDYFRAIYGNNFVKGNYYADGTLKISSTTNAKQGFQTCMFESNLKLEIRLLIGQMNNSNDGNKIDKSKPVLQIDAFDENGKLLRTGEVASFDKTKENGYVRLYMDGTDVAYLEVRAIQLPYKSSQTYNFAFKGIDLIAWPYPL